MIEALGNMGDLNFNSVWEWLMNHVQNNEFMVGLILAGVLSTILYSLRGIPNRIWNFIVWRFSCEVVIYSTEQSYDYIENIVSSSKYASGKYRRFRISEMKNVVEKFDINTSTQDIGYRWGLTTGGGKHYTILNGRVASIEKELMDKVKGIDGPVEKLTIVTAGPSKKTIQWLLDEAMKIANEDDEMEIYQLVESYWNTIDGKEPRSMDTIYIPDAQKNRLIKAVQDYLDHRDWYRERGIPWRLGISLEGPPGTGKTSLAVGLASHFNIPLYYMNVGSISESSLFNAMALLPKRCILLIEDFDCIDTHSRQKEKKDGVANQKISMSGFLNAIDGATTPDGRILIMTTNHPDKIDPAVLRNGRIDFREHIGTMSRDIVGTMVRDFYDLSEKEATQFTLSLDHEKEYSPCKIQGILIENKFDPESGMKQITKL